MSRDAQDAKTAEAAIYYFRQDFPRAFALFKEVLSETKDWDQIKYCSYWLKELKRKMSFPAEESFSCGPEALRIVLNKLGINEEPKKIAKLFKFKERQVSLLELSKVASQKGLKPKVVRVTTQDLENLDKPLIALVEPEHYIVVTQTGKGKIKFIDPQYQKNTQTSTLEEFSRSFKGYCLIFLEDMQLAKAKYPTPSKEELQKLKGGVCWCCPASDLGDSSPNTEYDDDKTCPSAGMPSWKVNTVNLNFIIQDIDFSYTSKGMPVEFVRTYNADDPTETIFGRSWTFNYNVSLTENPDTSIDIRRGDGRIDHFIDNGSNYQGPKAIYDRLTKNPDGTYILKLKADKSTYNFNSQGKLLNIKDKNNNTLSFNYDAQGKLTTLTDPNGKNTTLAYGANNKVSKITLPDGRYAEFVYDSNNNLTQSKDMVGAVASFTYDAASYITEITTPHQGKTTLEYETTSEGYALRAITDSLNNKRSYSNQPTHYHLRITDSRNNATLYATNDDGYTGSITTPSGNTITFEYDIRGDRNKIKDSDGNSTTLTYDLNGNVQTIKDALNNQISLEYDENDNLKRVTDPKTNIYDFTYDANSNLTQIKNPDDKTTSFEYNPNGQLTRITDANNGVTDFTYDVQGNLAKQTNPLDKITTYGYDTLGRLTSLTDPKSQTFSYIYDGVNHLTKITYPDASTITYAYNCCNLTEIQDSKGTLKFSYDSTGRLKTFANYDNKVISYDYDGEDNLTKLTYPDAKEVLYEYDQDNRLIKVTDWLNNITTYSYDSRGNLASSKSPGLLTLYKYDNLSRLTKLLNYNATNYAITSGFEFILNELSNRTKIKRYLPSNDPTFNLPSSTYSYNLDNQLTSSRGKTFAYDDNGNLLQATSSMPQTAIDFTYDPDNQLTQYNDGTNNLQYSYDALGNRIKKTVGSTVTKYIVDPNRGLPSLLCDTNSSGTITAYYVYGLGLISKIEGSNAYYYQYDGLGSTVAITDKNGVVKNKYAYDDFGNLATNSSGTISNPFKYVGKFGVMTDLNDLLYMRARYYIPSIGRFINQDPIGLGGGLNLYGYVRNNPINYIDPKGKIEMLTVIIIISVIAAGKLIYSFYQTARWGAKAMDKARQIRSKFDEKMSSGMGCKDESAAELFKTEEWKNTINYGESTAIDSYTTP